MRLVQNSEILKQISEFGFAEVSTFRAEFIFWLIIFRILFFEFGKLQETRLGQNSEIQNQNFQKTRLVQNSEI